MKYNASWIWAPPATERVTEVCFFRKMFHLASVPDQLVIAVSADSSYRLYCNGRRVAAGPCRGDRWRQYYERIDLAPYLAAGNNVIAAVVVHFPYDDLHARSFKAGPTSIYNATRGGFYLEAEGEWNAGPALDTGEQWSVLRDSSYTFHAPWAMFYAGETESVDGSSYPHGWNTLEYAEAGWQSACIVCEGALYNRGGALNIWQLTERPIPLLKEEEVGLRQVMRSSGGSADWQSAMIGQPLVLQPGRYTVEFDAGIMLTAFIGLELEGGQGSEISLLTAECYYHDQQGTMVKQVRDASEGGILLGETDRYYPGGRREYYEPLYYRAFRFLRLDIEVGAEPLTIVRLSLRQTGYPLAGIGSWHHSDPSWQGLWDVSIRTLQCCMQDTYVDTPYHEQMQYIMDAQLQMLYSYQLSPDDRLARKAILDFHSSVLPNGHMLSSYPTKAPQVIPAFSIYWIRMIHDHYMYFGDLQLVKRYMPTIDAILAVFERQCDEATGMVGNLGYWMFIDWVQEWDANFGVPPLGPSGISTIHNLIYVYGLQLAAELKQGVGQHEQALQLQQQADNLRTSIRTHARCPDTGLFRDSPDAEDFSQHAQVWAVLSGTAYGNEAAQLLSTMQERELPACSYSMSFYLFRALRKAGLYEASAAKLLAQWQGLLELNVTTWPEDPVSQRSDCHGWSALPLYELASEILGVAPDAPGYAAIRIAPQLIGLNEAQGTVSTRYGAVEIHWALDGHRFAIRVGKPIGVPATLVLPDGRSMQLPAGESEVNEGCSLLELSRLS